MSTNGPPPERTLKCVIDGCQYRLDTVFADGWAIGIKGKGRYAHPPGTYVIEGGRPARPLPPPQPKWRGAGEDLSGAEAQFQKRLAAYNRAPELDPHHKLKLLAEHIGIQPGTEIEQLKKAVEEYYAAGTRSTGPR